MILRNKNRRIKNVLVIYIIAITLIILGIAYIKIVDRPVCPINRLTGLACPTCGVTRMLTELVTNLNLYQAFRYNPLMFVLLPSMLIIGIVQTINYLKHGKFTKHYDKIISSIAIIVIAFGILRNIPMLCWLLPTKI